MWDWYDYDYDHSLNISEMSNKMYDFFINYAISDCF